MEKEDAVPGANFEAFQRFQRRAADGPPEPAAWEAVLQALGREARLEHALAFLKQARVDPVLWSGFQARLKAAVAQSRIRRMNLWQIDPNRRTLRVRFEVRGPACLLHPPALLAALARTLMDAGLPVAMGLEKTPRPAVHLGHPLPLGVAGWGEWADVALQAPPALALEALPAHLNGWAPEGLRILACEGVPNIASPVAELCHRAHWRWCCPPDLEPEARERIQAFLASTVFELEKPGKVGGQKEPKRINIRGLLDDLQWDGPCLDFQTRISGAEAANPRKLLAAILGLEPASLTDLSRVRVELREDPRLLQAHKFEPKLHNMFEDAVLLDSGGNIQIIDDDDDDEPLILGAK